MKHPSVQDVAVLVLLGALGGTEAAYSREAAGPEKPHIIVRVEVRGLVTAEEKNARSVIQSRAGTRFDPRQVAEDVRALWKLGSFEDIKVLTKPRRDGRIVLGFEVTKRPRIRSVRFEFIRGHRRFDFPIDTPSHPLVDHRNQQSVAELLHDFLATQGYPFSTVTPQTARNRDGTADVSFIIQRGVRATIHSLRFVGNRDVADQKLRALIPTENGRFNCEGGFYLPGSLGESLLAIREHYYDRGKLDVRIHPPRVEVSIYPPGVGNESIDFVVRHPELSADPDERALNITIAIEEGDTYRLGKLSFGGDPIGPPHELEKLVLSRTGAVFNKSVILEDLARIQSYCMQHGFHRAIVSPGVVKIDPETHTVDLVFRLSGMPKKGC